jgi:hypothetical protein
MDDLLKTLKGEGLAKLITPYTGAARGPHAPSV